MKKVNNKKRQINDINNAPKTNRELSKDAKKLKHKAPKCKYSMKVYLENGKEFIEIQAVKKGKFKTSMIAFAERYPEKVLIFGEIRKIKPKITD